MVNPFTLYESIRIGMARSILHGWQKIQKNDLQLSIFFGSFKSVHPPKRLLAENFFMK